MRALVTGGAGYIGSHLVVELLQAGHDVVVLDDLSTGSVLAVARAERAAGRGCTFWQGDIADRAAVAQALRGVDVVFHLAGSKQVGESTELPERYLRNNVGGMTVLIEQMELAGVRRMVFSSSAAVYGTQDRMPVAEDAPLRPDSPYGLTKMMGEQLLQPMSAHRGWAAVSLRYFNPVGAHPSGTFGEPLHRAASLVPRALRAVLEPGAPLTVFGADYPTPDGTCLRDYVHVVDLARAHIAALAALDRPGHRVCNVGTGRPYSVREVLEACARVTGRPVPSVDGARRPGDVMVAVADVGRMHALLGFRAEHGLDEMVSSAWRWAQHSGAFDLEARRSGGLDEARGLGRRRSPELTA